MLRKWSSLPSFDDLKSEHRNSVSSISSSDQPDGVPSSVLVVRPELLPVRPSSCNAIYPSNCKIMEGMHSNQEQNTDFRGYNLSEDSSLQNYSFEINDSDDDNEENYYSPTFDDDFLIGNQGSQFMLPFYGAYPRGVSNSTYTELLDGIEFDKLKEKYATIF